MNAHLTRSIAFEGSPTGAAAAMHVVGVPSLTHPTLTHWATTVA
ncbi:hypothetical protein [Winogradskya humida]|uniref:Uncharacterized protein n=1 Tax=Winogradskya humida TaxID=113566 RepID=A0ABQ4A4J2_9ACTN|nr:hypothetical protein [Actinoplanes humidus]GIE25766.1 hypothetical protein Ahu01nite_088680 [Actinoplanes humidus]